MPFNLRRDVTYTKTDKLRLVSALLVAGFALCLAYSYIGGALHGGKFPHGTMLFNPLNQFSDFYDNWFKWHYNHQHLLVRSSLSVVSLGNLMMFGFSRIFPDWVALFVFLGIGLAFYLGYCSRGIGGQVPLGTRLMAFLALTFFFYPLLFTLDRGNMQLYYFLLMAGIFYFYRRGSFMTAAALFGASLALKPFQIVFVALFLADRKYRELIAAASAFILTGLAASTALGLINGLSWQQFLHPDYGAKGIWAVSYHQAYVIGNNGLFFGHSLFGVIKVLLMHFYNSGLYKLGEVSELVNWLTKPYFVLVSAFYVFAAWFVVFREQVMWRRVTLLFICMTLLPFVSADYRLVFYIIPLFMFFDAPGEKTDFRYCVLFALVLIPKSYYFRIFSFVPPDTGLGIVATPAVLGYFAWSLIKDRLPFNVKND